MTVVFKGTPECIRVQLSDEAPFSDVLREFTEKLHIYRKFFEKGIFKAFIFGRELSPEEKTRIEAAIGSVVSRWMLYYQDGTFETMLEEAPDTPPSPQEPEEKEEIKEAKVPDEEPEDEFTRILDKWDSEARSRRNEVKDGVRRIIERWDREECEKRARIKNEEEQNEDSESESIQDI